MTEYKIQRLPQIIHDHIIGYTWNFDFQQNKRRASSFHCIETWPLLPSFHFTWGGCHIRCLSGMHLAPSKLDKEVSPVSSRLTVPGDRHQSLPSVRGADPPVHMEKPPNRHFSRPTTLLRNALLIIRKDAAMNKPDSKKSRNPSGTGEAAETSPSSGCHRTPVQMTTALMVAYVTCAGTHTQPRGSFRSFRCSKRPLVCARENNGATGDGTEPQWRRPLVPFPLWISFRFMARFRKRNPSQQGRRRQQISPFKT